MKRNRITVRWNSGVKLWFVSTSLFGTYASFHFRYEAVKEGRQFGNRKDLHPSQLVVFNKNGRISFEHTYPRSSDPRKYKG